MVLFLEFIEEMAGNNLEVGNEVEGGKENGGHEIEDKKLIALENVVLGVDLDNEQDYVSGGGRCWWMIIRNFIMKMVRLKDGGLGYVSGDT